MIRIGMEHKLCDGNFELLKEPAVCNTFRADYEAALLIAVLDVPNKSVLEENVVRPIYDVNFKISHIDEMLGGVKKKPSQGRLCLPFLDFSLIGEGSYERGS